MFVCVILSTYGYLWLFWSYFGGAFWGYCDDIVYVCMNACIHAGGNINHKREVFRHDPDF